MTHEQRLEIVRNTRMMYCLACAETDSRFKCSECAVQKNIEIFMSKEGKKEGKAVNFEISESREKHFLSVRQLLEYMCDDENVRIKDTEGFIEGKPPTLRRWLFDGLLDEEVRAIYIAGDGSLEIAI